MLDTTCKMMAMMMMAKVVVDIYHVLYVVVAKGLPHRGHDKQQPVHSPSGSSMHPHSRWPGLATADVH